MAIIKQDVKHYTLRGAMRESYIQGSNDCYKAMMGGRND